GHVPQAPHGFSADGGEGLAVRGEGQAENPFGWLLREALFFSRGRIPEAELPRPSARQEPAVGRQGQDRRRLLVEPSAKRDQFLARGHVPESHDTLVVNGRQGLALAGKREHRRSAGIPAERAELLAGGRLPQVDRGGKEVNIAAGRLLRVLGSLQDG